MPASRNRLAAQSAVSVEIEGDDPEHAKSLHAQFLIAAIGASAGGLDACKRLLDALADGNGAAFILVQHLDPNHESMMVELLSSHTSMRVVQAAEGMLVQPDHLYVIPPGAYISIMKGALHLVTPNARHGARLPFDYLLHSLAEDCGARAVCIVLSGTGTDGSLGLVSIKDAAGFVIVQKPEEAGYDGMPRSAIATGKVDRVCPLAGIPAVLASLRAELMASGPLHPPPSVHQGTDLKQIVDLLRLKTAHDFTLYKHGTLQRRIERRMGLAAIHLTNKAGYLELLKSDSDELELLAKDLLINVTNFFRDPKVFDALATTVIPDLVRNHRLDQPLRIWIAGCSTGEEAYSLAMLFREQITTEKRNIKLQVFASDVDPDAIAVAREGLYPESIATDVSQARLARFFSHEDHAFKVSPELRAAVVFTVQDVLADPPFSRLDLVSCRNLLIYLGPEAQTKVISLFHFALRQGGILLLGSAETAGSIDGRFEIVSKADRLYRSVGRSRLHEYAAGRAVNEFVRTPPRSGTAQAPSRQAALADLCRRLVLDSYAPAAVLINAKHDCLYSVGPTHRYLRVAQGTPTQDLLAMAAGGLRTKLRSGIQQASQGGKTVLVPGGQIERDGVTVSFDISVQPVPAEGDALMLICFIEGPQVDAKRVGTNAPLDLDRVVELEHELEATRTELQGAIHNLEISAEEQKAINEEALSVNEEFQSTNEELLTSKEELQSLNEELTALNIQLQETLDRQRTTANDLQNILYSTDLATLFLDKDLNIRFFTPATRSLFNVIPGDIGRPLADLNSLSADSELTSDAEGVLKTLVVVEREIETRSGVWFIRRILPYRTNDNQVEGVVITFADISERKAIRKALEEAKFEADQANIAKTRFLAAASHDLRQPLQTLTLIQALLARSVKEEKPAKFIVRLGETLGAMSGMLNTLLDINQIEAGVVQPAMTTFPINEVLERLRDEFAYFAEAKQITLRVVPSHLLVYSDRRLLEQMIRNLLSNAFKYTKRGKVLLGCLRKGAVISIEIWDTGIGIPDDELQAIFMEYHQLDNVARERNRGLGLGLSIVQRLTRLLDHKIQVRSKLGKGSVFAIEIMIPADISGQNVKLDELLPDLSPGDGPNRAGSILVVEDDPDVRELAELLLRAEGHDVATARDGIEALEQVAEGRIKPELLLADFNLPRSMNGLQLTAKLRGLLRRQLPVIIMTGDISTETMREVKVQDCVQLNKPVKPKLLMATIQRLLNQPVKAFEVHAAARAIPVKSTAGEVIYAVDDDNTICEGYRALLEDAGHTVETYPSCEAFLAAYQSGRGGCLLIDAYLPGMTGLELLHRLRERGDVLPAIMITGNSDVPMAVDAMKAGASDFLEKPVNSADLLAVVERALEQSRDTNKALEWREAAASHIAALTKRQRQIMEMVLAGHASKNIAADLGISQRTVENHRALIMKKTGSKSLPALARLAVAATSGAAPPDEHLPLSGPAPLRIGDHQG
ncbi:MAG: chemotaxis protein CheB [Hyphomicrobiaceae bacterium]